MRQTNMQSAKTTLFFSAILMLLMLSASATAQKKDKEKGKDRENVADLPEVIWRDPGDVASLNLLYGAGGEEDAPDPNGQFTFIKEDMKRNSQKFAVNEYQGVEWEV